LHHLEHGDPTAGC